MQNTINQQQSGTVQTINHKKSELRKNEILELGFPKTEIINDMIIQLDKCEKMEKRADQIVCAREIYRILSKPYSKKFLNYSTQFKNVVMNKLFEFRDICNLREARVWWRNVFGNRMPVTRMPITRMHVTRIPITK